MSSDPDRIAVPTNGRRPHPVPPAAATATAEPAADDPTASTASALPAGLSAQQIMVGFGIVASLIAIAAGVARRRVRR